MNIYIFHNIWNIPSTVIKIQSFRSSKTNIRNEKVLEVIICTCHFFIREHKRLVTTTRATENVLIKECSIAVAKLRNDECQTRTYTDSTIRRKQIACRYNGKVSRQFVEKRARIFSFYDFSRRLSRHSCEKRKFEHGSV